MGEMLHKNVLGSECFNPPENLHKNKTHFTLISSISKRSFTSINRRFVISIYLKWSFSNYRDTQNLLKILNMSHWTFFEGKKK